MKIQDATVHDDGANSRRPFCQICQLYHIPWQQGGWMCPNCGRKPEVAQVMKVDSMILQANVGEAFIAQKEKPKKEGSADFPYGAQIIKDDEYL